MKKLLLIMVLLFCFHKVYSQDDIYGYSEKIISKDFKINYCIKKIKIEDLRTDTSSRRITMPRFTMPGEYGFASPNFTLEFKNFIKKEIREYSNVNKDSVNIIVKLNEGYIEYASHYLHDRIGVYFDIDIELYDLNGNLVSKHNSKLSNDGKKLAVTNKKYVELYEATMEEVINSCMKKFER